jgi:predicted metal-dependent HD superfamily phosphohydrolase
VPALLTWWKLDVAELAPGAHSDAVLAIGSDLVRRLDEEHRRYHTTRHLVELFWALEDLERAHVVSAREAALGRMAGWFHDAVYDPTTAPGDNEIHSAELAVRDLSALGLAEHDIEVVRDLVLATQTHELAHDGLAAAFHDADLWILSAPRGRYDEYTVQVREEYAAVPDDVFASARAAILRPFIDRESIYATAFARENWEDAARLNLAAELETLTAARPR